MAALPRSTQEQNPGRTVWRTIVQVGIPALVALLVLVPQIINVILKGELGAMLPASAYAWLAGAAAVLTALAATGARIMAIPGVAEWLRKYLGKLAPDDLPPLASKFGTRVLDENDPQQHP